MGLTIDRDKVIKGLEGIIDYFFDVYRNDTDSYKCEKAQEYSGAAIEAIAMLKEQEAKKVNISQTHCGMKYGLCPQCGKQIDTLVNPNYCGCCGQEVKWE